MDEPKYCPECSEEITKLNVELETTVEGTYDLRTKEVDYDSFDVDVNTIVGGGCCPKCDAFLGLDELVDSPDDCHHRQVVEIPYKDGSKMRRCAKCHVSLELVSA